jgi:hypothetical protein
MFFLEKENDWIFKAVAISCEDPLMIYVPQLISYLLTCSAGRDGCLGLTTNRKSK